MTCVGSDAGHAVGRVWVCQCVVLECVVCLSPWVQWHLTGEEKLKLARFGAIRSDVGVSREILFRHEDGNLYGRHWEWIRMMTIVLKRMG